MHEMRERAARALANEVAQVANALAGGQLHEAAQEHYARRLWQALEAWRQTVGIPGDEWPIPETTTPLPANDAPETPTSRRARALVELATASQHLLQASVLIAGHDEPTAALRELEEVRESSRR